MWRSASPASGSGLPSRPCCWWPESRITFPVFLPALLAEFGGTVLAGSPADFGKLMADDTEKWAKVIKFAGIKAE